MKRETESVRGNRGSGETESWFGTNDDGRSEHGGKNEEKAGRHTVRCVDDAANTALPKAGERSKMSQPAQTN